MSHRTENHIVGWTELSVSHLPHNHSVGFGRQIHKSINFGIIFLVKNSNSLTLWSPQSVTTDARTMTIMAREEKPARTNVLHCGAVKSVKSSSLFFYILFCQDSMASASKPQPVHASDKRVTDLAAQQRLAGPKRAASAVARFTASHSHLFTVRMTFHGQRTATMSHQQAKPGAFSWSAIALWPLRLPTSERWVRASLSDCALLSHNTTLGWPFQSFENQIVPLWMSARGVEPAPERLNKRVFCLSNHPERILSRQE